MLFPCSPISPDAASSSSSSSLLSKKPANDMKEALELHNEAVMRFAGHTGSDHMVVLRAYEVGGTGFNTRSAIEPCLHLSTTNVVSPVHALGCWMG